MLADVWAVTGAAGASGEYVSPHARLFCVLEEDQPGSIVLADGRKTASASSGRLSYVPPGMRTWSRAAGETRLRHLDLHVDLRHFAQRLGLSPRDERLLRPRLMFANARIEALAGLLAEDCISGARHDRYGESLAMALLVELFEIPLPAEEARGGLSQRRLRLATDYLADNCLVTVRLDDVAALTGLSPSYFASAFKASTGLTPHQWQMQQRIARVKERLSAGRSSISDIASACGFADQAHLTRVFKRHSGLTPAAWLRSFEL